MDSPTLQPLQEPILHTSAALVAVPTPLPFTYAWGGRALAGVETRRDPVMNGMVLGMCILVVFIGHNSLASQVRFPSRPFQTTPQSVRLFPSSHFCPG
jgi:hypothetical protein